MEIAYWQLALIIGSLLGVIGILAVKKKDTRKNLGWGAAALVVIGIVGMMGYVSFLNETIDLPGGTDTPIISVTPSAGQVISGCQVEDTTVTLSAIDMYTASAVGGYHRYTINDGIAKNLADAGTFTASPGDKIDVLFDNQSVSNSYFAKSDSFILPCKGTYDASAELVPNGTVTIEVFNEEGNLIDGGATENETLAAGDVVTLSAKLKGSFKKGAPYGGLVLAEWNNTAIDDVVVDFGGSEVNVPQAHSPTYSAQSSRKAFSVPSIMSNAILTGSVVIDADDTVNPGTADDVKLSYYSNDYYINEDTGASVEGPAIEDEDDTLTKTYTATFTVHVD